MAVPDDLKQAIDDLQTDWSTQRRPCGVRKVKLRLRIGRGELQASMLAGLVVTGDVLVEHHFQMTSRRSGDDRDNLHAPSEPTASRERSLWERIGVRIAEKPLDANTIKTRRESDQRSVHLRTSTEGGTSCL